MCLRKAFWFRVVSLKLVRDMELLEEFQAKKNKKQRKTCKMGS